MIPQRGTSFDVSDISNNQLCQQGVSMFSEMGQSAGFPPHFFPTEG